MPAACLASDAVVIRFPPTDPQRVLASAEKEHRARGHYGLSVWAAAQAADETLDQLHLRILLAAQLGHINLSNNKKFYVCSGAAEITILGFPFTKDGDDDELPEHYCVDLGNSPTVDDVVRFLGPFTVHETGSIG